MYDILLYDIVSIDHNESGSSDSICNVWSMLLIAQVILRSLGSTPCVLCTMKIGEISKSLPSLNRLQG